MNLSSVISKGRLSHLSWMFLCSEKHHKIQRLILNSKAKSTWIFTYKYVNERNSESSNSHVALSVYWTFTNTSDLYMSSQIDMHKQAGHSSLKKPTHVLFLSYSMLLTYGSCVDSTHLEIKSSQQLSSASLQWPFPLIFKISSDYSTKPSQ